MVATELDLSEYWLMRWPIVAVLSLTGWLARQIPKKIGKHDQGLPFRIVSDFSHRFLQKQFGLAPGNNLLAIYFFLYLVFIWCNSIWEFYPVQTVRLLVFGCFLYLLLILGDLLFPGVEAILRDRLAQRHMGLLFSLRALASV